MDAKIVVGILVFVLSLFLEVIPGFTDLWAGVSPKWKPLIFLVTCIVIAFALPLLACVGVDLKSGAVCPATAIPQFITEQLFLAFAAWSITQATFTRVQDKIGKSLLAKQMAAKG